MRLHASVSAIPSALCLSLAFAIAAIAPHENHVVELESAMSCFVVAGKVACIEVGVVPMVPGGPAVSAPIGPDFTGDDEDIVIRDDGGRHVAIG